LCSEKRLPSSPLEPPEPAARGRSMPTFDD
jgi:hypothetical protein